MKFSHNTVVQGICLSVFLSSCQPAANNSSNKDIFRQDQSTDGNERRRPATDKETYWTISMGGCTGHLIAPEIMMTAAHCNPSVNAFYKSGSAIVEKTRADIQVTKVIESNRSLDYAILAIRWTGERPKSQLFPPSIAHNRSSIEIANRSTGKNGDLLFTVGFPTDKSRIWGPTYSQGYPMEEEQNLLRYNIGIINGNSGGGVWRKSDGMLVSLTNGGPNSFGQGRWIGGDAEDSNHWNHGSAMWHIYQASPTIRSIFPEGKNRYFEGDDNLNNSEISVAIDSVGSTSKNQIILLISTDKANNSITVCQGNKDCDRDATQKTAATFAYKSTDRHIHKTVKQMSISDGSALHIVSTDASGAVNARRSVRFSSK